MAHCLESRASDCKNCYKCIRKCPIKAISFINNKAQIIHDDCILCGRCFSVCPQNVKVYRNDLAVAKRLVKDSKVILSVAPSFVSNYSHADINTFRAAIKKLGFIDVEETAIGATIVKKAYEEMLNEKHDVIISSCCHTINLLIQKHYPQALPYLADVLSPMLAHGKDIKERYGKDTKVVFVGPCISKKDEADKNSKYIDCVLTYQELDQWLKEENVVIEEAESKEVQNKSKARLFPTCGGILDTMDQKTSDFDYIAIDGIENSKNVLQDIIDGKVHKCFIEISACRGSCVNGPVRSNFNDSVVKNTLTIKRSAGKDDFECYSLKPSDIKKDFNQINVYRATPSESEINATLIKMGKDEEKLRLNCGSCGYNSCREKAIAIIQGKAVKEMCLPFLMGKAQSFSDQIIVHSPNGILILNEDFEIQLINKEMCNIIGIKDPSFALKKSVTTILDPTPFADVLAGDYIQARKEYLQEYDKYVETTVAHDPKYHIIVCIMRDITESELAILQRDEIVKKSIEVTDKVIEKNMRAVQEIASLLGESVAETKVALTSLKESLKDE